MNFWLSQGDLGKNAKFAFSGRAGGVSPPPYDSLNIANWVGDVDENVFRNLAVLQSLVPAPIHFMRPEHSTKSIEVFDKTLPSSADILFTRSSNIALAAPSADCVSVVAASQESEFLLVAHIGWRGAVQKITHVISSIFDQQEINPLKVSMSLGPAISGRYYEVGEEIQTQVAAVLPESRTTTHLGRPGLDLRAGIAHYFKNLGCELLNDQPCTFSDQRLFSHRGDGVTGRQAAVAWLK